MSTSSNYEPTTHSMLRLPLQLLTSPLSLAVVSACLFGTLSYITETLAFSMYSRLQLRRLSSHSPTTLHSFRPATLLVFQLSVAPTVFLGLLMRKQLGASMQLDLHPLRVAAFVAAAVVLHDAWFFAGHTLMHRSKALFRTIHQTHHKLEGDLTVFGTASMEPLEACLLFMLPYLLLLLACHHFLGSWNPAALATLVCLEASMNMGGHSGCHLPWWLHLVVTGGLGLVPGCATSKSHYIHHLDPRYNRGLYFTWWDQLLGSFREDHPRIDKH